MMMMMMMIIDNNNNNNTDELVQTSYHNQDPIIRLGSMTTFR